MTEIVFGPPTCPFCGDKHYPQGKHGCAVAPQALMAWSALIQAEIAAQSLKIAKQHRALWFWDVS